MPGDSQSPPVGELSDDLQGAEGDKTIAQEHLHIPNGFNDVEKVSVEVRTGFPGWVLDRQKNKDLILEYVRSGRFDEIEEFISGAKDVVPGLDSDVALELLEHGQASEIFYLIKYFEKLDLRVSTKLVQKGFAGKVARYDKCFEIDFALKSRLWRDYCNLKHSIKLGEVKPDKVLFFRLLELGLVKELLENFGSFEVLDREIVLALLAYDDDYHSREDKEKITEEIIKNMKKVSDITKDELFLLLLEKGDAWSVFNNRAEFSGLPFKILLRLTEQWNEQYLDLLDVFAGVDYKVLAGVFVQKGDKRNFHEFIRKFGSSLGELPVELADELVARGWHDQFAEVLSHFRVGSLDSAKARFLFDAGFFNEIFTNIDKFQGLMFTKDDAQNLVSKKRRDLLINYSEYFEGLVLDQKLALDAMREGYSGSGAAWNALREGKLEMGAEAVDEIIDISPDSIGSIIEQSGNFSGLVLDKAFALKCISKGASWKVAHHSQKFKGLDAEVANLLIENGQLGDVIQRSDEYEGLVLDKAFALKCISKGASWKVAHHSQKFKGLDAEVANLLIENGQLGDVIQRSDEYEGLVLDKGMALKFIKECGIDSFVKYVSRFVGLDNEVASCLVEENCLGAVAENIANFHGLDQRIAVDLGRGGYIDIVISKGREYWAKVEDLDSVHCAQFDFFYDKNVPEKLFSSREVLEAHGSVALKEAYYARLTHGITPLEYHYFVDIFQRQHGIDTKMELNERGRLVDPDGFLEVLLDVLSEFSDEQIVQQVREGGEIFGAQVMLDYMNRIDLSRHDAVYFFPQLLEQFRLSGVSAEDFARNILLQVARDDAYYPAGNAHNQLAAIMSDLSVTGDVEVVSDLMSYADKIPQVAALVQQMDQGGYFASWKNLKKFYELKQLCGKKDLLEKLSGEPSPRIRNFISSLAFHPNISTEAVFEFYSNPAAFLEIVDVHAPRLLSERKKPSQYLSEPYLGLTAMDLRDALIGRDSEDLSVMDKLQTIPPYEKYYDFVDRPDLDPREPEVLYRYFHEALGKSGKRGGEKVEGKAKSVRLLFQAIQKLLKDDKRSDVPTFAELTQKVEIWEKIKNQLPDLYDKIISVIFDTNFGLPAPEIRREQYRVRIGRKSDPTVLVAGNDTASCMPFGSGKNNVYMFNPNCSQLVVERLNADGKWRTVAQSVLTINQKISQNFVDIYNRLLQDNPENGILDLINEADFALGRVLACDNVEIARNEFEAQRIGFIGKIYGRFFAEYLAEYAATMSIDPSRVVVGAGYTSNVLGFHSVENKTVPLVPVSYSDNTDQKSFEIPIANPKVVEASSSGTFVRPIEVTDVYAVSHLEAKAFRETSLGYGIHKVQNNILGIKIANEYFHRPNLSFIYKDPQKSASAYIIAYEGIHDGQSIVYVDDMAAEKQDHPMGGRLVLKFFQEYLAAYQKRDDLMPPIVVDARESTSFRMIQAQVQKLAQRNNLFVDIAEIGQHEAGNDVMHSLIICVGRTEDEVARLKSRGLNKMKVETGEVANDNSSSDDLLAEGA